MKSCSVLLHPTQDVNHPFVQWIHFLSAPVLHYLVAGSVIRLTVAVFPRLCAGSPSSVMLCHKACVSDLVSAHHVGFAASHITAERGRASTVQ